MTDFFNPNSGLDLSGLGSLGIEDPTLGYRNIGGIAPSKAGSGVLSVMQPQTPSNSMGASPGMLGNISAGAGIIGDLLGAYAAFKQFGIAEDTFKHNRSLDRANFANQTALAQREINQRDALASHQRPDLYGNNQSLQLKAELP